VARGQGRRGGVARAAESRADVLVVGGGLGGVAAALAACRGGASVVLTEAGRWLGGQATAQGVPFDEHRWIESCGCTASYRALREGIRAHYRAHYPLTAAARARTELNPGAGRVSRLCCEPRVTLAVLEAMLAPWRGGGRLEVLEGSRPVGARVDGDRVEAVVLRDPETEAERIVWADWVVEATETGELLALCGAEHVVGSESCHATGEPHAPARARPEALQPISVCFALEHRAGEDHTIARPAGYERIRAARPPGWPEGQLSLLAPDPQTNRPLRRRLEPDPPGDPAAVGPDFDDPAGDRELWTFRRIAARGNFEPGRYRGDVTLVNWPQIDYLEAPWLGGTEPGDAAALEGARELSLCFLHWLQAEAGYPGLRLRGDVLGAPDGLAAPYVREARRIAAETTVREQDVALAVRGEHGALRYPDSVGIGHYRIDLHPSTAGDPYLDVEACPFELPLGALLPVRLDNLLAGGKTLGMMVIA
jgi:hypothetical protein